MSDAEDPQDDPYMNEIIERTLAPYRALASPAVLRAMHEALVYALTKDEVGVDLLNRARPRAAPLKTGEEPAGGYDGAAEAGAVPRRHHG